MRITLAYNYLATPRGVAHQRLSFVKFVLSAAVCISPVTEGSLGFVSAYVVDFSLQWGPWHMRVLKSKSRSALHVGGWMHASRK